MASALYRIDDKGKETPLPSHAVFKGFKIAAGQTTAEFPLQKFYWKDPYARLVAEKTGNRTFRYKVVPLEGKPGHLSPMTHLPVILSNEVVITPEVSPRSPPISTGASFPRSVFRARSRASPARASCSRASRMRVTRFARAYRATW